MLLAVPKDSRYRTKQELVYRTLRDAIMRCELPPGTRLVIDDIARRLAVSSIPVREALQILQSDGLVINTPHVGATVAPISRESIREVFTILEGLEIVSTRNAALEASPAGLDELSGVVDSMDLALKDGRYEDWADLNTRFHLSFSRLSAMPLLEEMLERILARWDRVRSYFFSGVLVHRVDVAQEEHHALLAAMQRKDLAALEDTVRQHNQGALASYTRYLQERNGTS